MSASKEQREVYLNQCIEVLQILIGGAEVWEQMPVQYCKQENIGEYIEASLKSPLFMSQNTIENGAGLIHGMVENQVREMKQWAKDNGRDDLLIPMNQKIDNAIAAGPDA
jgi:hypothetical protein